ncbi:MAG: hypothetical protein OEZ06_25970 [Myxococcales bacterium]|nr:hypothetical protein [Myxococcales bacterium]
MFTDSGQRTRYLLAAALIAALSLGLRHRSLQAGLGADDYAQAAMVQGRYLVERSPLDLFTFSDGSEAEGKRLIQGGYYPWWTHPRLRLSMFRPLASAMIWLDWQLFGNNPLALHLHSLFWWLALLAAVAVVLARLLPAPMALLGFAFFSLDESQGIPLAWVANRCVLQSTSLALLALMGYLRARESGDGGGGWRTALLFSLALGFGEYALSALAYFVAFAVFADRDAAAKRLRALIPVLLPTSLYLGLHLGLGHGARHSGVYLQPLAEPLAFVQALLPRLPVMFADLTLGLRADYYTFGLPWSARLVNAGWVDPQWLRSAEPWRDVHIGLGVCAIAVLTAMLRAIPQRGATRDVHWLAAGAALSMLPVLLSFPSSRLLLVASLGFAVLLSAFVHGAIERLRATATASLGQRARALLVGVFGLYHLALPAWRGKAEADRFERNGRAIEHAVLNLQVDDARFSQQRVLVLAALEGGTSLYLPLARALHGHSTPHSCHTLSLTPAPHALHRIADNAFRLRVLGGATMLATAPEQLFRTPKAPLREGEHIDLGGLSVKVHELRDGLPASIEVQLDRSLDDPSLLFLIPRASGLERAQVPPIGGVVRLEMAGLPLPPES